MITTFTGPMFSNKSQKLIDIYNNIYNKKTIFTFKPNIDKRDMMYIKSRNNDFEIYSFIVDYFDEIEHIVNLSNLKKVVIFTHKRAFLGYLINILPPSYTLDDNLVIEYDDNVIYDNSKNDIDIYRLTFNNGNLDYIEKIIY